ncbi:MULTISPECIES: tetratricopeptide repeat protein [unclassified Nitrospina]|uniref:tetratricopeptide repeat protein n=1 Tax=unclassified Nitrospina TaxID=2638683 RepID=UPI003F9D9233
MNSEEEKNPDELEEEGAQGGDAPEGEDDLSSNFRVREDDPYERAQKEGGEEAEFDLESQIEEFRAQIEEEPDNCIHHYNLAEALEELGQHKEAREEYELALELDKENDFHSIIHFGLANMQFQMLLSGIQSVVVKSSIGLHSAHKAGDSITQVNDDDYKDPIYNFEKAMEFLPHLKADEDLVDYIAKEAPSQLANLYYKWASDLIDKSRQIDLYGEEIQDVEKALKLLKKSMDIDPNHAQAKMMITYAKKMLAEGWKTYDEYGFEAKTIEGRG